MPVSVVIATHNRAHTLSRALDSVLAQSQPVHEVILVDDGSEDHTPALVASRYPQVTTIRQPNRGVSSARNVGIRQASGTWIAFLDADDQWLPDKVAMQLAAIQSQPQCRIVHSNEIWIRNGVRINPARRHEKSGGWIFQRCLPLCVISPSSVIIHREVFEAVGCFDEELPVCEDYDLWLRICARYPVHYVEQALLVKFGGHADQLSRRYWGMDRFRISALDKILRSGVLTPEDGEAARLALLSKVDIYLQGARKRGNQADLAHFKAIRLRHRKRRSETCSLS